MKPPFSGALPRVYVLLLNWRGWRDTITCLETVFRLDYSNFRVILCDNDSGDESLERIAAWASGDLRADRPAAAPLRALFRAPLAKPIPYVTYHRGEAEAGGEPDHEGRSLILVRTGANLGFAGGNNVGLRYGLARGDAAYVWLLNNDTVVAPGALGALVRHAEANPEVGMVGSKLLRHDRPELIQAVAGGRVNLWQGRTVHLGADEPDRGQWNAPREVGYVTGASLLARSEMVRRVGVLDERYFLYSEEVDWCITARRAGWRLRYEPDSVVWHKEGGTVGTPGARSDYHGVRGQLLLVRKHAPALLPLAFLYSLWRNLLPKLVRRQPERARAVIRAYIDCFGGRQAP